MKLKNQETGTDVIRLYARIRELGYYIKDVAIRADIQPQTLYNRLNGRGKFTADEIARLRRVLHLSAEETVQIFIKGYEVEFM